MNHKDSRPHLGGSHWRTSDAKPMVAATRRSAGECFCNADEQGLRTFFFKKGKKVDSFPFHWDVVIGDMKSTAYRVFVDLSCRLPKYSRASSQLSHSLQAQKTSLTCSSTVRKTWMQPLPKSRLRYDLRFLIWRGGQTKNKNRKLPHHLLPIVIGVFAWLELRQRWYHTDRAPRRARVL